MNKKKKNIYTDFVKNQYITSQKNKIWSIDATYLYSGTLIIVIDLASRLIIGDLYLHGHKSNEFSTANVTGLVEKCYLNREINKQDPIKLTVHSDQGIQFTSTEYAEFCETRQIKKSIASSRGNQVSESTNALIKKYIRLRVAPETVEFKAGSFNDPLRKMLNYTKEDALLITKFAIESHNNNVNDYNQKLSPNEFDYALTEIKNVAVPDIIHTKNDGSVEAEIVQKYRDEVTLNHAGNWAVFFANWAQKQDKQFASAAQERAELYKQNQELMTMLKKQDEQMQILVNEQLRKLELEEEREQKRLKRKNATKQTPRDTITPQDFETIIDSVPANFSTTKQARQRVAFTLLYLTGLRATNLLTFSVSNLKDLQQGHSTLINIIKGGGIRKISTPNYARFWFEKINQDIVTLTENKSLAGPLFTNKKGDVISRVNFNVELNTILKDVSSKLGKKLHTHSFRITLITELLQDRPIQQVKKIIGHRDIRTTEIYDRNFMGEQELRKALHFVYKRRASKKSKSN